MWPRSQPPGSSVPRAAGVVPVTVSPRSLPRRGGGLRVQPVGPGRAGADPGGGAAGQPQQLAAGGGGAGRRGGRGGGDGGGGARGPRMGGAPGGRSSGAWVVGTTADGWPAAAQTRSYRASSTSTSVPIG